MNENVRLVPAAQRTSGMAIASLVLGISSFLCWIFTGLPAVILGIVALRRIYRNRAQLSGEGLAIGGIVTGGISTLLIMPVMVALLLPAVQAAREAALRNSSLNNMKHMMIALLNYHDVKQGFPAAGGGEGPGAQLSWRVHILPFIEEQVLYSQFHLDEPWDSEHNRALIPLMPDVYRDPSNRLPEGETPYLAVTGPGTAFGDGSTSPKRRDFVDGSSNTVLVVEADPDQSVVWTKPDDWKFDPNDPMRGLGSARWRGFIAGFADAHTNFIDANTDPEVIKALMTRDDREVLQP